MPHSKQSGQPGRELCSPEPRGPRQRVDREGEASLGFSNTKRGSERGSRRSAGDVVSREQGEREDAGELVRGDGDGDQDPIRSSRTRSGRL